MCFLLSDFSQCSDALSLAATEVAKRGKNFGTIHQQLPRPESCGRILEFQHRPPVFGVFWGPSFMFFHVSTFWASQTHKLLSEKDPPRHEEAPSARTSVWSSKPKQAPKFGQHP